MQNNYNYYTMLITSATIINIVRYIPQYWSVYKSKNYNYYALAPQILLLISTGCLVTYSVGINDDQLIIFNSSIIFLAAIELLQKLYYASYNKFSRIPHKRFLKKNLKNNTKKYLKIRMNDEELVYIIIDNEEIICDYGDNFLSIDYGDLTETNTENSDEKENGENGKFDKLKEFDP